MRRFKYGKTTKELGKGIPLDDGAMLSAVTAEKWHDLGWPVGPDKPGAAITDSQLQGNCKWQ